MIVVKFIELCQRLHSQATLSAKKWNEAMKDTLTDTVESRTEVRSNITDDHNNKEEMPMFFTILELCDRAHDHAVKAGFYDSPPSIPTVIALMHSELSEALEAHRNGDMENFAEELADVVIRIMDTAAFLDIDLETEIVRKMARNENRGHRHGGKAY